MSRILPGDGPLHYEDGSHRWIGPSDKEQEGWEAQIRAHLDQHRATLGAALPAVPVQRRPVEQPEPPSE